MSDLDERAARRAWFEATCVDLHDRFGPLREGEPASYIPELASVDPDRFAIAAMTTDGESIAVGDVDQQFTIQSISKLIMYGTDRRAVQRDRARRRCQPGAESDGQCGSHRDHRPRGGS